VVVLALVGALAAAGFALFRTRPPRRLSRSAYDDIVGEAARRHHVSPFLVKAVIEQESGFDPWVTGAVGEVGLMQITTGAMRDWEEQTAQRCRLPGLLFDPRLNIEVGTWYLGKAQAKWRDYRDGDALALAQYNAGARNATRWAPEDPREAVRLDGISFPSTREYIRRVRQYRRSFEREHGGSG